MAVGNQIWLTRYSPGVMPMTSRKAREKFDCEENPVELMRAPARGRLERPRKMRRAHARHRRQVSHGEVLLDMGVDEFHDARQAPVLHRGARITERFRAQRKRRVVMNEIG